MATDQRMDDEGRKEGEGEGRKEGRNVRWGRTGEWITEEGRKGREDGRKKGV